MDEWVRDNILMKGAHLYNRDHEHLSEANIGWLWTNKAYDKQGRRIIGTAEIPKTGGAWGKARTGFLLERWFGDVPDFLITLYAPYFAAASDAERLSLIEHEMYHCSFVTDEEGNPIIPRAGGYLYTMRGHDVEEFLGVVRRYGPTAEVARLVEVAQRGPTISHADICRACGTCK